MNNSNKTYHILNGDMLKEQFPKKISGEIIISRECLIDGEVQADSLEDFYKKRALFIVNSYEGFAIDDYHSMTVSQFSMIEDISVNCEINLWFEDDLFCQTNFWFILTLLNSKANTNNIYLVRPLKGHEYSFSSMNEEELISAFNNKIKLSGMDINKFTKLWDSYSHNDLNSMIIISSNLKDKYPFVLSAVKVHIQRIPNDNNLGRPINTLKKIISTLKTNDFNKIFKEFQKTEAIYGFGDLQVKKLLESIK